MSKDKELLKLAAKAAGIELHDGWNPLTNDGDAMRLAVKLGISIQCLRAQGYDKTTAVQCQWGGYIINVGINEGCNGDPDAAARRAIVRAAAEIGRAMT